MRLLIAIVVLALLDQGRRLAENLPGYVEDLEGVLGDYPEAQR